MGGSVGTSVGLNTLRENKDISTQLKVTILWPCLVIH